MSEADRLFEELGYKKQDYGKSYTIFSCPIDEEEYCIKSITFEYKHKRLKLDLLILTMEELKAINIKVKELGWE